MSKSNLSVLSGDLVLLRGLCLKTLGMWRLFSCGFSPLLTKRMESELVKLSHPQARFGMYGCLCAVACVTCCSAYWGKKTMADPGVGGAGDTCAWNHSTSSPQDVSWWSPKKGFLTPGGFQVSWLQLRNLPASICIGRFWNPKRETNWHPFKTQQLFQRYVFGILFVQACFWKQQDDTTFPVTEPKGRFQEKSEEG